MTGSRLAAAGALLLVVAVFAALILSGSGTTIYKAQFQTATLLVKGADVQVGGHRVGSVKKIELTDDNKAQVTFDLENALAPLHTGTTATIRATSLSGVANRYVALTPGPNSGPKLDAGAVIGEDHTTSPVSLDQLFDTLDPKTRRALQNVIQGQATWYQGKGRQTNAANRFFNPSISSTTRLFEDLNADQQAFTDLIVSSSKLATAVAERRDDLASLIANANATSGAIAGENAAFDQTLATLPTTLRKANTTFVNLRSTLDDLDALVAASKPAVKKLGPFLRELEPLLREARPTLTDLSASISSRGAANDFTDAERSAVTLAKLADTTFPHSIEALRTSQPVIDFIRPYTSDLVGWLRDFSQGAANYDANGHFARVQPEFFPFKFVDGPGGGTLVPVSPGERLSSLKRSNGKRCPGSATQAPLDASAPFLDGGGLTAADCDPTAVPPGP